MHKYLCLSGVLVLALTTCGMSQTNSSSDKSAANSILNIQESPVRSDIALNIVSGWFNDGNKGDPQNLRDYGVLKPTQLVSSVVVLHKIEYIGGTSVDVEKVVTITQGETRKFQLNPGCTWDVSYKANSIQLVGSSCTYPQGARGYFDVTTMYTGPEQRH